jgi:acyl-CoA synthetase (AMP-forming)/AMP-acid ligase II
LKTEIHRGYHSRELFEMVRRTWESDDRLLIVCPPGRTDLSFADQLAKLQFPSAPVFGVFTSGTVSGQPRLVLYSRENILSSLNAVLSVFDRSRITSIFGYPQPFHTFGLTLGYLLSLVLKRPLHFQPGKYSTESHALRVSLKEPGLLTLGTPAHLYDLCHYIRSTGSSIAPSYSAILGGASVDPSLWRDVVSTARIEAPSIGYGCTEASPAITHLAPGEMPLEIGEIGRPLSNLRSRVSSLGVEIRGPSLCMAMLDGGEIKYPSSLIIPDDIHVREDGKWVFRGRLDLTLNRGGMKIALEDVERSLKDNLGLTAVAFEIPSERLGQDLALAVISNNAAVLNEVTVLIEKQFSVRLAPSQLSLVSDFPLSESGKIDRKKVRSLFLQRDGR